MNGAYLHARLDNSERIGNMVIKSKADGTKFELKSPTKMPRSAGFLWNRKMMIQMNCRGFAVAQFMQPEPAKYAYAPNLEAKTFMQPEQPYFSHHPGRFFYIKDEETGELFSAPYEPVKAKLDHFSFTVGKAEIEWEVVHLGIRINMQLSLPVDDVVEIWRLTVTNTTNQSRPLSVYPYFPIGYMSWMNQSAEYNAELTSVIAKCVTPYQRHDDYFKQRDFKDLTFFLSDRTPNYFELNRETFEGEGGLHNPASLQSKCLNNGDAIYETPVAATQYRLKLPPHTSKSFNFLFGPAKDHTEIVDLRNKYLGDENRQRTLREYENYLSEGSGSLQIQTPDGHLDDFVNHWLPRQVFYHGDVNRLTTDPQTRNFIQDNMGMSYIKPSVTRRAFLHALAQQEESGAMPDGILLSEQAELKYINQIPHTDHCVWLPVCLRAYLDETNDYSILEESVRQFRGSEAATVLSRITKAMRWLFNERDTRGLSFIAQGDWCDPMNMVGYRGLGVSGWLSIASVYAFEQWAEICRNFGESGVADEFSAKAVIVKEAINRHLWDGDWYARGITDDGNSFGISDDDEGRIFLNPQSWAILANVASDEQQAKMISAIEAQLETPYGVMMLAPSYTAMRDDIGRVTQKHPGSAENGSIYNHAAVFYIYSLYRKGDSERAFRLMRQMLVGPDTNDYLRRGQLPVFVPNYYRGAYHQFPRTAGRSSQLFNTGTVAWLYRCVIEGLFGLTGCLDGLRISPQLPKKWETASVVRQFRGATINLTVVRGEVKSTTIRVDGEPLDGDCLRQPKSGEVYQVVATLPFASEH